MQKQTIWVDAHTARKLKVIAARTGATMLEIANTALNEYLKRLERAEDAWVAAPEHSPPNG